MYHNFKKEYIKEYIYTHTRTRTHTCIYTLWKNSRQKVMEHAFGLMEEEESSEHHAGTGHSLTSVANGTCGSPRC